MTDAPASRREGLPGAYFVKPRGRTTKPWRKSWRCILHLPHRTVHLGYYASEREAHEAWLSARLFLQIKDQK